MRVVKFPRYSRLSYALGITFASLVVLGVGIKLVLHQSSPAQTIVYEPVTPMYTVDSSTATSPQIEVSLSSLVATGQLSQSIPVFAQFTENPSTVTPGVPSDLGDPDQTVNKSEIAKVLPSGLTADRLTALKTQGFFLTPSKNYYPTDTDVDALRDEVDEMSKLYSEIGGSADPYARTPDNTVFITTDFLAHSYHVFVDRTFQYIEQNQFHPILQKLSWGLTTAALESANTTNDPVLKNHYQRLAVFFSVPTAMLQTSSAPKAQDIDFSSTEPSYTDTDKADTLEAVLTQYHKLVASLPQDIQTLGEKELDLIAKSDTTATSPLLGVYTRESQDYTQFRPRSHYTKNSRLRTYWRAMMWYGRQSFPAKNDAALTESALLNALVLSTKIGQDPSIKLWQNIYLPTVFFVGKSDDLSFYDYNAAFIATFGTNFVPADITDTAKFAKFKTEVAKLAGPSIQSSVFVGNFVMDMTKQELQEETKGFRFMGQRFIPDSYMFSTLTQGDEKPDPETGQRLPSTPTNLMIAKLLGSAKASDYLDTWIQKNAPNSDKVLAKELAKLNTQFSKLTTADWTSNMYWSWLYTLKSLLANTPSGYPPYMLTPSWQDKNLNTMLGSWTELRHDTLLYAKQSYAEMGGGGPEDRILPPQPKGYVEPNIVFINRLIALAQQTQTGLKNLSVLPQESDTNIARLIDAYKFYAKIASQELANQPISDADFEKLRTEYLSQINYALKPLDAEIMTTSEVRSGLIADVHTDVPAGQILYEATGIPNTIVVIVNDKNGLRLTRGLVYTQYEFTGPLGTRYSDQDWQAVMYGNKTNFTKPSAPDYIKPLQK